MYTPKELVALVVVGFIKPFMTKGEEASAPDAIDTAEIDEKVILLVALL